MKYPRSAQLQNIPAVPNCKVSLPNWCPFAEYPWSGQQQNINILAAHLQCCKDKGGGGGREMLHFLYNNGFRMGMLEINNFHLIMMIEINI